jgi:hypothetical protein
MIDFYGNEALTGTAVGGPGLFSHIAVETYAHASPLKAKHEANTKLLELSHQIYRKMTSDAPETYLEIICNNEDGTIRSREDIHAEILSIVKNKQVPASKGFFGIA